MELVDFSKVTADDLMKCEWESAIKSCNEDSYEFSNAMSLAAKVAHENGDSSKFHSLGFLSCACSLQLRSSDIRMPFRPAITMSNGTTSTQCADFKHENCTVIKKFVNHVSNPELASRLCDIVWVVTRDYDSAKNAIKYYVESSKSDYCTNNWFARIDRLERALRLSFMVKDKDSEDVIMNLLFSGLDKSYVGFELIATHRIGKILLELNLLDAEVLGDKLLDLASQFDGDDKFKHDLLEVSYRAFSKSKSKNKLNQARLMAAEALLAKANEMKKPGKMIAASYWLTKAIAAFQKCEGQSDRVRELQKMLTSIICACENEMQKISVKSDITEMVNEAVAAMQNKNTKDALLQFAYLSAPMPRRRLEEQALNIARSTVFQSTGIKQIFNGDGRLVALIPPILGSEGNDYDLALRWEAYRQATLNYSLISNGAIIPARNELLKLHQIDISSLHSLLDGCAFFPEGRQSLWLKGFKYGFFGDFDAALSILIPQFEHALRKCLETRGALVWRVDPANQFHSEKSLNELFKMQEATEFLGDDLKFILEGLLTEKIGENFRNESTHGLMSEGAYYSPSAVYLWWLLFHMVVVISQSMTVKI